MTANWEETTLGSVCVFERGLTYAKGDEVEISKNIVLRANNIDLQTNRLDFGELKYISDSISISETKRVKKDSLLICTASGSKSHLGKVACIDADYGYAFGGFMGQLTASPKIEPRYLFHLMTSPDYKDFIASLSDGANINNLKFDVLRRFPVPLPPLPEQRRIVGILDEAFATIAAAKANAEQNRRNASAVFEGYLQAAFAQRDDGLEERRLDQLYRIGSSKRVLKSQWTGAGVPFYRGREITALATEGHVDNELFISEEHYSELSKQTGVPKAEDIMITAIGTIGNAYIVHEDDRFYFKDASVLWMRRNTDVNSEFVKYWLGSSFFFDQLDRGNGATVDTLTIQKLQSVTMPLPTVAEQRRIVSELTELRAETQHLESLYTRKLAALDELKQSLLHQAFSGAL